MEDSPCENMAPGSASQPDHDENTGQNMDSTEFAGWLEGLEIEAEVSDSAEIELWPEDLGNVPEVAENSDDSEDSEFESQNDEDEVSLFVNIIATLEGIGTFMSSGVLYIPSLKRFCSNYFLHTVT